MAPVAKEVPVRLEKHGDVRVDPYSWLRDDERTNPEVLAHLDAENAYATEQLGPVDGFRRKLFEEMIARMEPDDSSVPYLRDGYFYYDRFEAGGEYPLHCRKVTLDGPEQVLIDANQEAKGRDFYQLHAVEVSPDGKRLAFAEDTVGRQICGSRFRDLETGRDYPDRIEDTAGMLAWAADNQTVFYARREEGTLRAHQVWRHRLGDDPASDTLVYEEQDPEFHLMLWLGKSKKYVFIGIAQTLPHEVRFIDAGTPTSEPRVFLPRSADHEYYVEHHGNRFYVRTNWDAPDFRWMSVEPDRTMDRHAWREEIPSRPGVFLIDVQVFRDFQAVAERIDGITRLRIMPWSRSEEGYEIAFDEVVYSAMFAENYSFDTRVLRFVYSSFTTPPSVFDYDMATKQRELKKQDIVRGGFLPAHYRGERMFATASDGTQVPISLVYRRDLDRSVPHPLVLYGYGAYGICVEPDFGSDRLSLLDRGVVFAIAHVRGGQECGRAWYEAGKLLNKQNSFTDFVACAEQLIRDGWTRPDRLVAMGSSAGGLLMAAVLNMRPDLFHAIVADVPFVDILTSMLDETIPLTTLEYSEWGNANQRTYYDYIRSYSPYDNVERKSYPHLLVLSALYDSQVQYWEPTKWVARIRANNTGDKPILLFTQMQAGHQGPSGRLRSHEEAAMAYAFALQTLGIRD